MLTAYTVVLTKTLTAQLILDSEITADQLLNLWFILHLKLMQQSENLYESFNTAATCI